MGGATGSVRIQGELSGRDPFNQGDDSSDVFAFVADGSQDVVFENIGLGAGSLRIVDVEGRTLAAPSLKYNQSPARSFTQQFRFRPQQAGVYYLVVTDSSGAAETGVGNVPYSVSVTGLVPTTVGSIRTGAGSGNGATAQDGTTIANTITVLTGDVGSIRVGTAFTDGTGQEQAPTSIFNTVDGTDDAMTFQGGTFSIAGTLYNITTGGDIGASGVNQITQTIRFDIGGNLGTLITGKSPVTGIGPTEGDLNFIRLNVGGSIGSIDVQGGIGMDQDAADPRAPVSTFQGHAVQHRAQRRGAATSALSAPDSTSPATPSASTSDPGPPSARSSSARTCTAMRTRAAASTTGTGSRSRLARVRTCDSLTPRASMW
jgi:hypothetical protein